MGIQPHLHHQRRMISRVPLLSVMRLELAQIQLLHRSMDKKTQVLFPQHLSHIRRQQISLLRTVVVKVPHRASSCAKYIRIVNASCHTGSETCATEGPAYSGAFSQALSARATGESV